MKGTSLTGLISSIVTLCWRDMKPILLVSHEYNYCKTVTKTYLQTSYNWAYNSQFIIHLIGKVSQFFKEIGSTIYQLDRFLRPSPPGSGLNLFSLLKIFKITIYVELLIWGMIMTQKTTSFSLSILFNSALLRQRNFNWACSFTQYIFIWL